MPIKGEVSLSGGGSKYFELPDPQPGEIMSGSLELTPGVMRKILWAPWHMTPSGSGRVYLKRERVGDPIASCDLPKVGQSGTLTDNETGIVIHLART